jgi:DNA transformation protein
MAMDRDYLIDLFSEFGPISLRKMFSGFGITADGVNFAMALRAGIIFRVDELTIPRYDAEGAKPFQYDTRNKTVVVQSYRHLPERLYDDPEELAEWAREAVGAARRAAAKKSGVKKRAPKKAAKPASSRTGERNAKPTARKAASAKAKSTKAAVKRKSAKKR